MPQTYRKIFVALYFLATGTSAAYGQADVLFDLRQLPDHADIIVIAQPVADTAVIDKSQVDQADVESPYKITKPTETAYAVTPDHIDVITPFRVLLTFKGDPKIEDFTLHHYRGTHKTLEVDSLFLNFNKDKFERYLMFLQRTKDGRYIPADGHYWAKPNSIILLR